MPLVKRALLGSVSCAWQHLALVTLPGFRKFTKKDIIPRIRLVHLAGHGDEAVGGGVYA